VIFIRSTKDPAPARVIGFSERGDEYRRIIYRRGNTEVQHDVAPVDRLSLASVRPPPRPSSPANDAASSSNRAQQRAAVNRRPKRLLQSTQWLPQLFQR
jgi:hypothetical protein